MRVIRTAVFAFAALALLGPASAGDDGQLKRDFKDLGKTIGHAGRDVGLEVADAAKTVWYKGKEVSRPLLRDVQQASRDAWAKVIDGKNRTIEALRRENEDLRTKVAKKGGPR